MRLALWTPALRRPQVAALVAALRASAELVLLEAEPRERPAADLDLYHVADDPAHGFVYRALLERPGLLWLEHSSLQTLVHAETAGRGDAAAYLREARLAHGPAGAFVAAQVLRGQGGALVPRLRLHQRFLESALAVITTTGELRDEVALLVEVPVVAVPLAQESAAEAATVFLGEARQVASRVPEATRRLLERREQASRPLGRALEELRPFARELGLRGLPPGTESLLDELFAAAPARP